MIYEKPEVLAQNAASGSYAAGCPANTNGMPSLCKDCERTAQYTCVSYVWYDCPSGKLYRISSGKAPRSYLLYDKYDCTISHIH